MIRLLTLKSDGLCSGQSQVRVIQDHVIVVLEEPHVPEPQRFGLSSACNMDILARSHSKKGGFIGQAAFSARDENGSWE
jgi:hypothetical protein